MTFLGQDDKSNALTLRFLSRHDNMWLDILACIDWHVVKIGTHYN